MKRILLSIASLLFAGSVLATATGAFFGDTETSVANIFAAGEINLTVANESYYNGDPSPATSWDFADLVAQKFFDFADLKPGDWGEDTIGVFVETNDAYLCADISLTSNDDNGINEPEGLDGDTTDGAGEGELAAQVNFVWWADDGDNVLESDETPISQGPIGVLTLGATTTVALADTMLNIWNPGQAPGPVQGGWAHYIGKAWCFGTLTLAPLVQDNLGINSPRTPANSSGGISCDGSGLNNTAQTDSLTADIAFSAVQSRNNDSFVCVEDDTPTFGACSPGQQYVDASPSFDQGRTKLGALIVANRSNPAAAFGAPQTGGGDSDVGFPAGSFVSLGFGVATSAARTIVLDFADNVVVDEGGADLKIFETTGGVYPDEHVKVEVAQAVGGPWFVVAADAVRDEEIDITSSGLAWARYVRITDLNVPANFSDTAADGYDLDAVQALHCGIPTP